MSSFWTKFWTSPTVIAIIIEDIILNVVNTKPNNEYVANIESTPVIGVDIKKLWIAPLLAPSFFSPWAKGITEQQQTGNGIPNNVSLKYYRFYIKN